MDQDELTKMVRRGWWSARGVLLFILPLPLLLALLISLIRGDLPTALSEVAALTLYLGGAVLARKGFARQAEQMERGLERAAGGLPFKTLGALLVSVGTYTTGEFAVGHETLFSLFMAALTFLGFYFAYGLEALPVGLGGKRGHSSPEAQDLNSVLEEALQKIEAIELAGQRIANAELRERLQHIVVLARDIVKIIDRDPVDLQRVRKFLYVYLEGAQKIAQGYVNTHQLLNPAHLENSFRTVLVTIEDVFKQQRTRLLERQVLDLDVQIEVLNTQLKREGLS